MGFQNRFHLLRTWNILWTDKKNVKNEVLCMLVVLYFHLETDKLSFPLGARNSNSCSYSHPSD